MKPNLRFLSASQSFLLLFILAFIPLNLEAQRIKNWVNKVEHEQYIEGTFTLPVSVGLDLLSFYSSFEPYEFGNGQQLSVSFHSPAPDRFFLKADEIRIQHFYRMESKVGQVEKGKNIFSPWSVDGILKQLRLNAPDLGILIRFGEDDSKYILPAKIFHYGKSEPSTASYKLMYRLSKNVKRGTLSIYKGEHQGVPPESQLVQKTMIGQYLGGSILDFTIPAESLNNYQGWCTAKISLQERGKRSSISHQFYFYHRTDSATSAKD